jgi:hypothetical protein
MDKPANQRQGRADLVQLNPRHRRLRGASPCRDFIKRQTKFLTVFSKGVVRAHDAKVARYVMTVKPLEMAAAKNNLRKRVDGNRRPCNYPVVTTQGQPP